jgi:ribosome-binding protein aMBF1 (putative translation factor)
MNNQDDRLMVIGNKKLQDSKLVKKIVPKNKTDRRAIKIENETENFSITKIPMALSKEITNARNAKKMTQRDVAVKLNIITGVYVELENGKAVYDGKTKQLIQKIAKLFGIQFMNK